MLKKSCILIFNILILIQVKRLKKMEIGDIVIAPEGIYIGITQGKEYLVTGIWDKNILDGYGWGFTILDDNGRERSCLEKKCSHINNHDWILKPTES